MRNRHNGYTRLKEDYAVLLTGFETLRSQLAAQQEELRLGRLAIDLLRRALPLPADAPVLTSEDIQLIVAIED